ncbi:MAG: hypothetical protein JO303_01885 [Caulobacteraceae bacterium]|nr:hypothetical protein [Caulobacteraceae bacterium]
MLLSRRGFGWGVAALAAFGAGAARAASADWPNVFISPCGQPFRAKTGAPYPVVDWFRQADKNGDGKIDHDEFTADAAAFFKVLDLNGDGLLDSYEVENYEHNVCPEVLGYTVDVSARAPGWGAARLWLAQDDGGSAGDDPSDSGGPPIDQPPTGAGPYELQEIPEPITAADTEFNGIIRKADFLALADRRFTALDLEGKGFLVLAKLPQTYVQRHLKRRSILHL